ncbi:unnamed protein product [Vitrella brassicaformis CCMP3155]|uniref:Uncharacterized protein n=2 Tax=Vitrella brassicaformis TaxID=1169539 RepID=A0A0G4FYB4_VITBC|nr:unnamed protein product [Vitrella brassicaformis CCMP3155]|eukprot:CEM19977.1 unnamed protein product [Vitrella brassicaformis CCMP3155]
MHLFILILVSLVHIDIPRLAVAPARPNNETRFVAIAGQYCTEWMTPQPCDVDWIIPGDYNRFKDDGASIILSERNASSPCNPPTPISPPLWQNGPEFPYMSQTIPGSDEHQEYVLGADEFFVYNKRLQRTGEFDICWCSLDETYDGDKCDHATSDLIIDEYTTHAGMLTVRGPHADAIIRCYVTLDCPIPISGFDLHENDTLRVAVEQCSMDRLVDVSPLGLFDADEIDLSTANPGDNGSLVTYEFGSKKPRFVGEYYLCWCPRQECIGDLKPDGPCWRKIDGPCDYEEDYARFETSAGMLIVNGPTYGNSSCVAGHQCSMNVTGMGLADGDMIVVSGDDCSVSTGVKDLFTADDLYDKATASGGGELYDFGRALYASSTAFYLCWCPQEFGCDPEAEGGLENFTIHAGNLTISGPDKAAAITCVIGVGCTFSIAGTGLSDGDSMLLSNDSCASPTRTYFDEDSSVDSATASGGSGATYHFGIAKKVADSLSLCWCQGSCDAEHIVSAGSLTIRGPDGSNQISCLVGEECPMTITGTDLNDYDAILVSSTTCTSPALVTGLFRADKQDIGTPKAGGPSGSKTYEIGDKRPTRVGDFFLCWCASPDQSQSCSADYLSDFNVTAGTLIVAPAPSSSTTELPSETHSSTTEIPALSDVLDQNVITISSTDNDDPEDPAVVCRMVSPTKVSCPDAEHPKSITLEEGSPITDVEGTKKDDVLTGNTAANVLTGGGGNDRLVSGGGNDVLIGMDGADTFVVSNETGDVTIPSFDTDTDHDVLDLSAYPEIDSMEALIPLVENGSVIIRMTQDRSVHISGLTAADLQPQFFALSADGGVKKEKDDSECGWFAFSDTSCVETRASIAIVVLLPSVLLVLAAAVCLCLYPTRRERLMQKYLAPRRKLINEEKAVGIVPHDVTDERVGKAVETPNAPGPIQDDHPAEQPQPLQPKFLQPVMQENEAPDAVTPPVFHAIGQTAPIPAELEKAAELVVEQEKPPLEPIVETAEAGEHSKQLEQRVKVEEINVSLGEDLARPALNRDLTETVGFNQSLAMEMIEEGTVDQIARETSRRVQC